MVWSRFARAWGWSWRRNTPGAAKRWTLTSGRSSFSKRAGRSRARLAPSRMREADVEDLESLLHEIDYSGDVLAAEDADRRFHLRIAEITGNSAMHAVVEMLWEARDRSPQYRFLTDKAHEARVVPSEDEHAKILDALRSRDPAKARAAMRSHITRVLDALLHATEVHELEQAKARVEEQRRKLAGSV